MSKPLCTALPLAALLLVVVAAFVGPACLDGSSSGDPDQAVVVDAGGRDLTGLPVDGATGSDGGEDLAGADQARPVLDFTSADLTGLQNCYDVAVCDPTMDFCIKYHDGSMGNPGKLVFGSPACYTPSDTCANQGQNMDCGCIQNDGTIGVGCQGACVDNMDGTFDCYAS